MDFLGWITDVTSSLPLGLIWALGSALSFAESGLGLGLFFPGETAILIVSAALTTPGSAVVMFALVTVFACAGDHVGYLLGRRHGPRIRETRLVQRIGPHHWDRAIALLEKQGARAILFTRPVPIVRILTPTAAGVAGATYPRFLPASFSGAFIWSALYVGLGYLLRSSLNAVEKYLSSFGYLFAGVLALAVLLAVARRILTKRRERDGSTDTFTAADAGRSTLARIRRRPLTTGLAIRLGLAVIASVFALAGWYLGLAITAALVGLCILPTGLPTLLASRRSSIITTTGRAERRIPLVDRLVPAAMLVTLAAVGRTPLSLAISLGIVLVTIAVLQAFLPSGADTRLPNDVLRALAIAVSVVLVATSMAFPAVGFLAGIGTVIVLAAMALGIADGVIAARRLNASVRSEAAQRLREPA
ncbi:DedA family protein [Frondihabitans sp. VKM Ac-2883]|uniref:DedA family protein n=1 Tax=Frondihabitans sp. VKM Ac-2883 TaxID=2783823 RepID=UPI001889E40A|nr:DedA family protein [Frondihabitans sp. VKM Ac-2883]MBF4577219.1 VTT domain-containing protein [Frondihabitans sp. VKM Ac-2883]